MTTEPIGDHLARVLRYIVMIGDVGVGESELDYFAAAIPPTPDKSVLHDAWMESMSNDMFWVVRKGQKVTGYLAKVGWITVRHGICFATPLAARLVREMNPAAAEGESQAAAVIINPSDPMRYQLLAQVLAGADLLVDPYFKAIQIDWLAGGTSIQRVLISRGGADSVPRNAPKGTDPNRVQIEMELGRLLSEGRPAPEVRITESAYLHDRAVVYGDRPTALLGTSLSGVDTHLSICTPLPQPASDAYTPQLEALWMESTPLEPRIGFAPPEPNDPNLLPREGEPEPSA